MISSDEDKIVKVLSEDGHNKKISINKQIAYDFLKSMGFYIEEYNGMCQQTDTCWSGVDKRGLIITNDFYIFRRYDCDNCGSIIICCSLHEYVANDWGSILEQYERDYI